VSGCNDDPVHNERIQKIIKFYEDTLQVQKNEAMPQAVLDKTIRIINSERSKLFPCTVCVCVCVCVWCRYSQKPLI
jgi:hypothetical protein